MIFKLFTSILKNSSKKMQCYAIAWLFHFKMSPNTARYVGPAVMEIIYFLSRTVEFWDIAA